MSVDKQTRASYHNLARGICGAFIANRAGMTIGHALKQVPTDPERLGDLWYELAQLVDEAGSRSITDGPPEADNGSPAKAKAK